MDLERLYLAGKALGLSGLELKNYIDRERDIQMVALAKAREARRQEHEKAMAALQAQKKELQLKLLVINEFQARERENIEKISTAPARFSPESDREKEDEEALGNERARHKTNEGDGSGASWRATHAVSSRVENFIAPHVAEHSFQGENDLNHNGTSHAEDFCADTGAARTSSRVLVCSESSMQQTKTVNSKSDITAVEVGSGGTNKHRSLSRSDQHAPLQQPSGGHDYAGVSATYACLEGVDQTDYVSRRVSCLQGASKSEQRRGPRTHYATTFISSGQVDIRMSKINHAAPARSHTIHGDCNQLGLRNKPASVRQVPLHERRRLTKRRVRDCRRFITEKIRGPTKLCITPRFLTSTKSKKKGFSNTISDSEFQNKCSPLQRQISTLLWERNSRLKKQARKHLGRYFRNKDRHRHRSHVRKKRKSGLL